METTRDISAEDFEPFGHRLPVLFAPLAQHVIDLMPLREVAAHAEAHPGKILRSQKFGNILQAVMPSGAPLRAQPQRTERQCDIVRNDQQILRGDLFGLHPVADGLARKIHIGRGFEQNQRDVTPQEELDKLNVPRETVFVFRDRGTGRPTKKERRELDGLMDELYYDEE